MIKIFLVEDEFVVREGIKNNIDWKAHHYQFCGEASDGELAFPMIKKEHPDIVITDIRMPFMDGLELSRLIRKELPDVRIIILSGHEEFEYAKKAIQIGVEEYLLKPIRGDELLLAVGKVAQKIKDERENASTNPLYQQDIKESVENAKRHFFNMLISEQQPLTEIIEKAQSLDMDLTAEHYLVLLLKINRKVNETGFSHRLVEIDEKIDRYLSDRKNNIISFDRAPEGKAYIFMENDEDELKQRYQEFCQFFEETVGQYQGMMYFGGVGKIVKRVRELGDSYELASRAFSYRFIVDDSQIIELDEENEPNSTISLHKDVQLGHINSENLIKVSKVIFNPPKSI